MANYALQIPDSLYVYTRKVAEEEQVSMNQFFVTAIAEKVSALKTEAYFKERIKNVKLGAFDDWLTASPDAAPMQGDEK
jgi:pyridoxine/pyridoxamine 5'-phosphate oxidase